MSQAVMEPAIVKRETISTQVAAKLRQDIFSGKYKPGEKLPPEREIAETFGIARVTVRQALQEMAREEWIEIVQGRGATVLDFSRRVGLDILPTLLSSNPMALVNPETFQTMHDFSNWLYKQICVSAAKNSGSVNKARLLEIISGYKDGISAQEYFRLDEEFYYELLDTGNNLVLRMFFNTFMKTFQHLVDTGIFLAPPLPKALYLKINKDLINAICSNKPDQINSTLEKHKSEVQSALNRHLKAIGIDILGAV